MSDKLTTEYIANPGTIGDAERNAENERQAAEWEAAAVKRRAEFQAERERTARFHSVTVTTQVDGEGTEDECRSVDRVVFACAAPSEAECRTYPKYCGCESFEWNEARTHDVAGHPRTSGNDCWVQAWFDADGAIYTGADEDDSRDDYVPAIDRTGLVVVTFSEEWIEWDWFTPNATDAETESSPAAQLPLSTDGSYLVCSQCGGQTQAMAGIGLGHVVCGGTWVRPKPTDSETKESN